MARRPCPVPVDRRSAQRRPADRARCQAGRRRLDEPGLRARYLGPDAPMRVDALTVHPYLGFAALRPFVDRAAQCGSCLLVVTRSSNPEGRAVQASVGSAGRSVEQSLLDSIGELNAEFAPGEIGPIGAVIGPTHMDPRLDLASPNALYLAPGVGRQGARRTTSSTSSARAPSEWSPARRARSLSARIPVACATPSARWSPSSLKSS